MKKVVITIDSSGEVTKEAFGFAGKDCIKHTAKLDKILGTVENRKYKDDFYRAKNQRLEQTS